MVLSSGRTKILAIPCWTILLCTFYFAPVCVNGRCLFSGRVHALGDIWHPQLETSGASICATCECHVGGKVNCTTKECQPGTCPNPREEPEKCCASCQEIPPEVSSEPNDGPRFSCLYHGRIYRDGDSFVANTTGLKLRTDGKQCIQCVCQDGSVFCEAKVCEPLTCPITTQLSSTCCPICDGQIIDCHSGGQVYPHGSTWHLFFGSAQMGCEECNCKHGKIECEPLRCPAGRRACLRLVDIPEKCCPNCMKIRKGVRNQNRGNGNRKIVNNPPQSDPSPRPANASVICLPAKMSILVQLSQATSNSSGYIQFLFIFAGAGPRTELHSWTIKDGRIGDFKTQNLSPENTSLLQKAFKFNIIGATKPKFYQKFGQREKRLKRRCSSRCAKKLERLPRALKLKEVQTRQQKCLKGETAL